MASLILGTLSSRYSVCAVCIKGLLLSAKNLQQRQQQQQQQRKHSSTLNRAHHVVYQRVFRRVLLSIKCGLGAVSTIWAPVSGRIQLHSLEQVSVERA